MTDTGSGRPTPWHEKLRRAVIVTAVVLVVVVLAFFAFFFVAFQGGISSVLLNRKPAPDPVSRKIVGAREQAAVWNSRQAAPDALLPIRSDLL